MRHTREQIEKIQRNRQLEIQEVKQIIREKEKQLIGLRVQRL